MGKLITKEMRAIFQQRRDEEKDPPPEFLLRNVTGVGEQKPLGYLPVSTISGYCGAELNEVIHEVEQKGLRHVLITQGWQESLYVWHPDALQELLDRNRDALKDAGWSASATAFVEDVGKKIARFETPIYDIVADAFGDYDSPGRLYQGPGTLGTTTEESVLPEAEKEYVALAERLCTEQLANRRNTRSRRGGISAGIEKLADETMRALAYLSPKAQTQVMRALEADDDRVQQILDPFAVSTPTTPRENQALVQQLAKNILDEHSHHLPDEGAALASAQRELEARRSQSAKLKIGGKPYTLG